MIIIIRERRRRSRMEIGLPLSAECGRPRRDNRRPVHSLSDVALQTVCGSGATSTASRLCETVHRSWNDKWTVAPNGSLCSVQLCFERKSAAPDSLSLQRTNRQPPTRSPRRHTKRPFDAPNQSSAVQVHCASRKWRLGRRRLGAASSNV